MDGCFALNWRNPIFKVSNHVKPACSKHSKWGFPIYGKTSIHNFWFNFVLIKLNYGTLENEKKDGGRYSFGSRHKIHVLMNFDIKTFPIQKFLVTENTLGHGHIGSSLKDFLPLQSSEWCSVLSTWWKPPK